jgi:hypothetical protein
LSQIFLRQLLNKGKIDEENYERIHMDGNTAINGQAPDPFGVVMSWLEEIGLFKKNLERELEIAAANSSIISYLQVGRLETILIADAERIRKQMEIMDRHESMN